MTLECRDASAAPSSPKSDCSDEPLTLQTSDIHKLRININHNVHVLKIHYPDLAAIQNQMSRRILYHTTTLLLSRAPAMHDIHQNLCFVIVCQNSRPWILASSYSSSLGERDPSPPANVPAPQGEPKGQVSATVKWNTSGCKQRRHAPPRTSLTLFKISNVWAYPSGTKMMPWCASVESVLITVVSWPPPGVPVETNTPASLP